MPTNKSPAPVNTGQPAPTPIGPLDKGPAPVPQGAATGVYPQTPSPKVPQVTAPKKVAVSTEPTEDIIPVFEQPVGIANTVQVNVPATSSSRYVNVYSNGTLVVQAASTLNFIGNGVSVTAGNSSGSAQISIVNQGGGGNANVDWNNISNNILPSQTSTYDLGSGSNRWSTVYAVNVGATGDVSAIGNIVGNYIFGNGSQLTGINVAASTGNIGFAGDTMYDLNGLTVNNGDLSHGSTSALVIPANGNTTDPTQLYNTYGNIVLTTGPNPGNTVAWTFDNTGGLNLAGAGVVRRQDSVNIVSNGYSQLQWVDSGNLNLPNPNDTGGITHWVYVDSGGAHIETNYNAPGGSHFWDFNTDGTFSAPGNIVTTGNISGNYFIGNGSQLTGLPETYGNANVAANLASFGSNPISTTGNITTTANISGNYFIGNGSQLTGITSNYGNSNVAAYLPTYTGNLGGGNIGVSGVINAVGEITSFANIVASPGGYFIGNGSQLTGLPASYGNANVAANLAAFGSNPISTTGNVTASYFVGNGSLLTGITTTYGNADVSNYLSSGNAIANIITTGNVTGSNLLTSGVSGLVSASGNITGGNMVTAGIMSSTGNATHGNIITAGLITATGNITGNYIFGNGSQLTGLPATYGNANVVANLAALGSNPISTTGNVTAGYFVGNGSLLTGITTTYGNANVAAYLPTYTGNLAALTGNVTTTANISGNYFIGNGALLTGITASGGASITNGTSNVVVASSANVTTAVTGNVITTTAATGQFVTGLISATGNITGNYFVGNGSLLTGITSAGTAISNGTSNVSVLSSANITVGVAGTGNVAVFATDGVSVTGNVYSTANVTGANLIGTVRTAAQSSITSVGTLTSLLVSGGVTFSGTTTALAIGTSQTSGTITVGGTVGTGVITVGQSTASQTIAIGNGIVGVGNTRTINIGTTAGTGTTAIAIGPATGNSSLSIGAFAPVTIANTGNAALSVVGNITGGNIITAGSTGNITGANVISATTLSATGNINGGNVNTGILSASGNVTVSGSTGVSQPNLPAFRVYGNTSTVFTANTTITNQAVDYNQGSYYNNTTGIFTAPVAGIYQTQATLRVADNNALNQASIQKNSSQSGANVIAFWETDTNTGTATHFAMAGAAKLAVGDTLRLQVVTGNVQFDTNDSWSVTYLG